MRVSFFVTLLFLCNSIVAGNSLLALNYPFGLPITPASGTAFSMGNTSIGIQNDYQIMLGNAANLGFISYPAFSTFVVADYLKITDHGSTSRHLSIVPQQFSFAIPLRNYGAIAFSLTKNSDASLKFRDPQKVPLLTKDPKFPVYSQIGFDRTGGISAWHLGYGYKITNQLSLGCEYRQSYGIINRSKLSEFTFTKIIPDTTKPSKQSEITVENIIENDSMAILYRSQGISGGILAHLENWNFGLSAIVFPTNTFKFHRILYTQTIGIHADSSFVTNVISQNYSVVLPPTVSLGIGWQPSLRLLLGADVSLDLWNYAKIPKLPPAILPSIEEKNCVSFSVGVRYIPSPNLLLPKYWETIHYRFGVRYVELPGKFSTEKAASVGLGLPLRESGLLDFAIELGIRESQNYISYNETFIRIGIGLNQGKKRAKTIEINTK